MVGPPTVANPGRGVKATGPARLLCEQNGMASPHPRSVVRRAADIAAESLPEDRLVAAFGKLVHQVYSKAPVRVGLFSGEELRVEYAHLHPHNIEIFDLPESDLHVLRAGNTVQRAGETLVPVRYASRTLGVIGVRPDAPIVDPDVLETCAVILASSLNAARLTLANVALVDQVGHDPLTGVANRRRFDAALINEWDRMRRSGKPLSVMMVDIDFYKAFNDRYGHQRGDTCLQLVAKALESCAARAGELLARYGGEEFGAILPSCDATTAILVAERMRSTIAALNIPHEGSSLERVSITVGVATMIPDAVQTSHEFFARADHFAYDAKKNGRNRVVAVGYESVEPPIMRTAPTHVNLPTHLASDEDHEALDELERALVRTPLVTLVGADPAYLMRLALRAGVEISHAFEDGVFYAELATIDDSEDVIFSIGAALGLPHDPSNEGERLLKHLRSRSLLLVLDGCGPVMDAVRAVIPSILDASPHVRILVTAPAPLEIARERVIIGHTASLSGTARVSA